MIVRRQKTPAPHIPFISLADIAWQIIIFFLIAATFATHTSMNVDLPSSSNNKDSGNTKTITIQAGNSALMLNGENVNLADLTPKLIIWVS